MPQPNELSKGKFIGKLPPSRTYIWRVCECGTGNWVQYDVGRKMPRTKWCPICLHKHIHPIGDKAHTWKGGRIVGAGGYIYIFLTPDSFFYPMAKKRRNGAEGSDGYVLEHRLVMAMYLKRCLLQWEIVHHKNGIRSDNRIENLQLLPNNFHHITDTQLKLYSKRLEERVIELENLIKEAKLKRIQMINNSYNKQVKLL